MARQSGFKIVVENRKARHDYRFLETHEAGIELRGTEVKSIRQGRVNLTDSYAQVKKGELWLVGMHVSPYEQGNRFNHEPLRERRLLMHKREIMRLYGQTRERGLTLVPTKLYLKNGRVKVELALAQGRRDYDKRDRIRDRDLDRQAAEAVKRRRQDLA